MRDIPPSRRERAGYTLVELLVVMLIIAILVSLVTGAVMKGIVMASETQTRAEIGNLETAIGSFLTDFNVDYIPSYLVLREDWQYNPARPDHAATVAYLQKMFGKSFNPSLPIYDWNGNGIPGEQGDFTLQGQHCLVFLLGGISTPAAPFSCQGFSTNPANPSTQLVTGEKRRGPYFPFQSIRLMRDPNNRFLVYKDPWKTDQPYAFFSSYKTLNGYFMGPPYRPGLTFPGDCPSLQVAPYFRMSGTTTVVFENNQSYQIISAGRDGVFGPGGTWDPVTGVHNATAAGGGEDDQSNFSRVPLGNPQQ
jgi:prepilin-type N-terminal cleavage/methylation domain-containing protein